MYNLEPYNITSIVTNIKKIEKITNVLNLKDIGTRCTTLNHNTLQAVNKNIKKFENLRF